MKRWLVNHKRNLIETIIVIICIYLLAKTISIISYAIYPEWNDLPNGNNVLLGSIGLGILVNLKNIIELLEKWFFKPDKYSLSKKDKIALEWINKNFNDDIYPSEFDFIYSSTGETIIKEPGNLENIEKPSMTRGIMNSLDISGLIQISKIDSVRFHCSVRNENIDRHFVAILRNNSYLHGRYARQLE